ncbi:MAG TPA: hypothetical protein VFN74_08555 [Chloroflexota bacterium]|nr:hypothetical protein [Chloroflexota bacterium]
MKEKRPFQLLPFPGRREDQAEREVGGDAGETEARPRAVAPPPPEPLALPDRTAALQRAMAEVHGRWGHGAVRLGSDSDAPVQRLAHPETRARLHGLPVWWPRPGVAPRPRSIELVGDHHGAPLSLALAWIAAARPALVAVVEDPGGVRFHIDAAAGAGIPLDRLIVVRPPAGERRVALDAAVVLLRSEAFDVVVCPLPLGERTGISTTFANKLATLASKAGTTLLLLTGPRGRSLGAAAEFRVRSLGRRWLWEHGELAGMKLRLVTERARAAGGAGLDGDRTEHEITLRMQRRARHGPAASTSWTTSGIGLPTEGTAADVGGRAGGADRLRLAAAVRVAGGERAGPAEEWGREAVAVRAGW